MKVTLLIFFLVTGIPAGVQFKQRHDLEERTVQQWILMLCLRDELSYF